MRPTRPFQFGLKALLGVTAFIAALTWLAREMEPPGWIVLPYVGLGLIQFIVAYELWRELPGAERHTPQKAAIDAALLGFALTMPTWFTAVVCWLMLKAEVELPPTATGVTLTCLVLHLPGLYATLRSWSFNVGPEPNKRLNVLRWLNLANTLSLVLGFCVLSAAILLLKPSSSHSGPRTLQVAPK